jgi:hypothetical protein
MKRLLYTSCILISLSASAQVTDEQFVKQKFTLLLAAADKDLETIKTLCKSENGLIHEEVSADTYTYTYESPSQDYYINVIFHFYRLYCKKVRIEIIPKDNTRDEISKSVISALKKSFQMKQNAVTENKTRTVNYFLSNVRFSGFLSVNSDSKKVFLTLSAKQD